MINLNKESLLLMKMNHHDLYDRILGGEGDCRTCIDLCFYEMIICSYRERTSRGRYSIIL